MNPLSRQCVEVGRECGDHCLSLSCLHLRNGTRMEHCTANQLRASGGRQRETKREEKAMAKEQQQLRILAARSLQCAAPPISCEEAKETGGRLKKARQHTSVANRQCKIRSAAQCSNSTYPEMSQKYRK